MSFDVERECEEIARRDTAIRGIPARLAVVGLDADGCADCLRWRDMKHPIQGPFCDEHWRQIRALREERERLESEQSVANRLCAAFEAGFARGRLYIGVDHASNGGRDVGVNVRMDGEGMMPLEGDRLDGDE